MHESKNIRNIIKRNESFSTKSKLKNVVNLEIKAKVFVEKNFGVPMSIGVVELGDAPSI